MECERARAPGAGRPRPWERRGTPAPWAGAPLPGSRGRVGAGSTAGPGEKPRGARPRAGVRVLRRLSAVSASPSVQTQPLCLKRRHPTDPQGQGLTAAGQEFSGTPFQSPHVGCVGWFQRGPNTPDPCPFCPTTLASGARPSGFQGLQGPCPSINAPSRRQEGAQSKGQEARAARSGVCTVRDSNTEWPWGLAPPSEVSPPDGGTEAPADTCARPCPRQPEEGSHPRVPPQTGGGARGAPPPVGRDSASHRKGSPTLPPEMSLQDTLSGEGSGREGGPASPPGRQTQGAGPVSVAGGQAGPGRWDQARAGSVSCPREGRGRPTPAGAGSPLSSEQNGV